METLDKHFRDLTRAAFARYGFAESELTGRWAEIAGAELARVTTPERIKWPRGAGESTQKSGGTLIVRAAPGRGLEVSYAIPQIIERINRFLGYGAVTSVKVVQAGSWPGVTKATAAAPVIIPHQQQIAAIADEGLRAALERLGAGIAAAAQGSPQGK